MKVSLIFQLSIVQSFKKKLFYYTKIRLKVYFEHNSYIFTTNKQALIYKLSHILWGFMMDNGFPIIETTLETTSPPYILSKCQWSNSFILPSNFSLMVDGQMTNWYLIQYIINGLVGFWAWYLTQLIVNRFSRFLTNHFYISIIL